MSRHICQINGICLLAEITTPSCGVRFVLIQIPPLHHMYQFMMCGGVCVQFSKAEERKGRVVEDSGMRISTDLCL